MDIDFITDENQFLKLRSEWNQLWKVSLTRSFFLTHEWIRCCWEELRLHHDLRILVLRQANKPVLIVPLMKCRKLAKGMPVDCLTLIEHPETQIADVLLDRSHANLSWFIAILRFLLNERAKDWDFLLLGKVSKKSATIGLLSLAAEACSSQFEVKASDESLFISLDSGWEAYLNSRSQRFRKTLRNVVNRIGRLGIVTVSCYRGAEIDRESIQKLFTVSDASWKMADGIALTSQKARMMFFEELMALEESRLWILEVNGKAIASEIQVLDGNTVYALRSDYDEQYADSSPGVYLQVEILRQLFSSCYEEYNFGVGINPYKNRWAEDRLPLVKFSLYNKTVYSRLLRSVEQYRDQLRAVPGLRALQQILGRT